MSIEKNVLVLGAGQLARMMSLAGAPLNIQVCAFDVRSDKVVHPLTQQLLPYNLTQAIAKADVITAEFEHIAPSILDICNQSGKLHPTPQAIKTGGDRRLEKALLDEAKVANAKYAIINNRADFDQALQTVGVPMVLKTALGGYDGKGQWRLLENGDIEALWSELAEALNEPNQSALHQSIVAEAFIPFQREVSMIGARKRNGDVASYTLTENLHINGVLALSIPVQDSKLQAQASQMFNAVANQLDYIGVLAIEFFDVDGKLLVNEIAPRVHNSGHWTQQGAEVCQFENHLRSICNLALGSTQLTRPTSMINLLGVDSLPEQILAMTTCHIHWYGKEKREGRKMGHINVCADNFVELDKILKEVIELLPEADFSELKASFKSN